jgi:hypothetical protein
VWLEKIGMLMPDEVRLGSGAVATFRPLRAVSATEKLATIIDFIEFCTACHAELSSQGYETVRWGHAVSGGATAGLIADASAARWIIPTASANAAIAASRVGS